MPLLGLSVVRDTLSGWRSHPGDRNRTRQCHHCNATSKPSNSNSMDAPFPALLMYFSKVSIPRKAASHRFDDVDDNEVCVKAIKCSASWSTLLNLRPKWYLQASQRNWRIRDSRLVDALTFGDLPQICSSKLPLRVRNCIFVPVLLYLSKQRRNISPLRCSQGHAVIDIPQAALARLMFVFQSIKVLSIGSR